MKKLFIAASTVGFVLAALTTCIPPMTCALRTPAQAASAPVTSSTLVRSGTTAINTPRQGEIGLSGIVLSLDTARHILRLRVEAFTLPSGKSAALATPKAKAVTLGSQTTIVSGKDGAHRASLSILKPGVRVLIIGPDSGAGKLLSARRIVTGVGSGISPREGAQTSTAASEMETASEIEAPPATELQLARARFRTKITGGAPKPGEAPDTPPADTFSLVHYPAAAGGLAAYLTPDPGDGKKHPAIIWITGGDCNSIGDVWSPAPRSNDQTAAAYRKAGIVMMFPSLRGGNNNPGVKEGFLGEVDDVLAATRYLAQQKYVDTRRIYLGGHSTGGTLALLVAECSSRFRDVFSFGPVEDVAGYGANSGFLPIDITDKDEVRLRSPGYWLSAIESPVWVFEGAKRPGNIGALHQMARTSTNPNVHFIEVREASHFTILAPTNELIAKKILRDTGPETNISFYEDEVNRNFSK